MTTFQKVYEEYARSVYRFLLRLTGDETMAEELLQETFYNVLQHIDRFEGRCSLYTWLCQIGKNAWYKELRSGKKCCSLTEIELASKTDMEEDAIMREDLRQIRRAMEKLQQPYQDVFIMHAIGAVKLKEIARLYGRTESWARVTYFRARQQIIKEVTK